MKVPFSWVLDFFISHSRHLHSTTGIDSPDPIPSLVIRWMYSTTEIQDSKQTNQPPILPTLTRFTLLTKTSNLLDLLFSSYQSSLCLLPFFFPRFIKRSLSHRSHLPYFFFSDQTNWSIPDSTAGWFFSKSKVVNLHKTHKIPLQFCIFLINLSFPLFT